MDIKEIMEIIPHRYPFLLIDKVIKIEENKITAIKNVTANEQYFQGHFPVEPVMPGVLIIEALAQAGAVALLSKDEFKGKIAYFAGINNAKFRRKVVYNNVNIWVKRRKIKCFIRKIFLRISLIMKRIVKMKLN